MHGGLDGSENRSCLGDLGGRAGLQLVAAWICKAAHLLAAPLSAEDPHTETQHGPHEAPQRSWLSPSRQWGGGQAGKRETDSRAKVGAGGEGKLCWSRDLG